MNSRNHPTGTWQNVLFEAKAGEMLSLGAVKFRKHCYLCHDQPWSMNDLDTLQCHNLTLITFKNNNDI